MKIDARTAGMAPMYWDASLSNLQVPSKFHKEISKWIAHPKHMLILSGPPGTGKTYMCAAILNSSWKDKNVRYFRDDDLYQIAKAAVRANWDGSRTILDKCSSKYLIIDDFGVDEITPYKLQCMERLIDYRYSEGERAATLITTNLTAEEIKEKYSERIYSRMLSQENKILVLEGYDLRGYADLIK